MNREEILNTIRMLAKSQGLYGRLLRDIENAPEDVREEYLSKLERQNFKEPVDLVLYLEE